MKKLICYLEDQLLARLQRRCEHPPHMVAADILEGCYEVQVSYCNRCGAVRHGLNQLLARHDGTEQYTEWRCPDPNLWRGFRVHGEYF